MSEEDTNTPTTESQYWCFISYRHADNQEQDRDWASWLHTEIERYDVPAELVGTENKRGDTIPERIYPVFRDEESLPADADLASSIEIALNRSRFLAVLCSPRAVESRYVAQEIEHFKQAGKGDRIIAAIVAGKPGDSEYECFPVPLTEVVSKDGKVHEPVAADFRLKDGSEGFTSSEAYRMWLIKSGKLSKQERKKRADTYDRQLQLMKLKVIAGILGVPLEILRDRDKAYQLRLAQRRARLSTAVAVTMISILLMATWFWWQASQARDVAQEVAITAYLRVIGSSGSDDPISEEESEALAELSMLPKSSEAIRAGLIDAWASDYTLLSRAAHKQGMGYRTLLGISPQRYSEFEQVLSVLSEPIERHYNDIERASILGNVGALLPDPAAEEVAGILLEWIKHFSYDTSDHIFSELGAALNALGDKLPQPIADEAAAHLIKEMNASANRYYEYLSRYPANLHTSEIASLTSALVSISNQASWEALTPGLKYLITYQSDKGDAHASQLQSSLSSLARNVSIQRVPELFSLVLEHRKSDSGGGVAQPIHESIETLAGRIPPQETAIAETVADILLDALDREKDRQSIEYFCNALAILGHKISAGRQIDVAITVGRKIQQSDSPSEIGNLLIVLGTLEHEETYENCRHHLLELVKESKSQSDTADIGRMLEELGGVIPSAIGQSRAVDAAKQIMDSRIFRLGEASEALSRWGAYLPENAQRQLGDHLLAQVPALRAAMSESDLPGVSSSIKGIVTISKFLPGRLRNELMWELVYISNSSQDPEFIGTVNLGIEALANSVTVVERSKAVRFLLSGIQAHLDRANDDGNRLRRDSYLDCIAEVVSCISRIEGLPDYEYGEAARFVFDIAGTSDSKKSLDSLVKLARRIPLAQRATIARSIVEWTEDSESSTFIEEFVPLLEVSLGGMTEAERIEVASYLLQRIELSDSPGYWELLSKALVTASQDLSPYGRSEIALAIIEWMDALDSPQIRSFLGAALVAVGEDLPLMKGNAQRLGVYMALIEPLRPVQQEPTELDWRQEKFLNWVSSASDEDLVEFLKWPIAVGGGERALLKELEGRMGVSLRGNREVFVRFADDHGIRGLDRPANIPLCASALKEIKRALADLEPSVGKSRQEQSKLVGEHQGATRAMSEDGTLSLRVKAWREQVYKNVGDDGAIRVDGSRGVFSLAVEIRNESKTPQRVLVPMADRLATSGKEITVTLTNGEVVDFTLQRHRHLNKYIVHENAFRDLAPGKSINHEVTFEIAGFDRVKPSESITMTYNYDYDGIWNGKSASEPWVGTIGECSVSVPFSYGLRESASK